MAWPGNIVGGKDPVTRLVGGSVTKNGEFPYMALIGRLYDGDTGAWSGIDTLANCNKVEHDKI